MSEKVKLRVSDGGKWGVVEKFATTVYGDYRTTKAVFVLNSDFSHRVPKVFRQGAFFPLDEAARSLAGNMSEGIDRYLKAKKAIYTEMESGLFVVQRVRQDAESGKLLELSNVLHKHITKGSDGQLLLGPVELKNIDEEAFAESAEALLRCKGDRSTFLKNRIQND